jgi:hypothetical protein
MFGAVKFVGKNVKEGLERGCSFSDGVVDVYKQMVGNSFAHEAAHCQPGFGRLPIPEPELTHLAVTCRFYSFYPSYISSPSTTMKICTVFTHNVLQNPCSLFRPAALPGKSRIERGIVLKFVVAVVKTPLNPCHHQNLAGSSVRTLKPILHWHRIFGQIKHIKIL